MITDNEVNLLNRGQKYLISMLKFAQILESVESTEGGLSAYLSKSFERVKDLQLLEDEFGETILDENGKPKYEEVEIVTQEEQDRDNLKKDLLFLGLNSSKEILEEFNDITKSKVFNSSEMHELIMYNTKVASNIVQLGKVSESLLTLGAKEDTLNDIKSIFEREHNRLKEFFGCVQ